MDLNARPGDKVKYLGKNGTSMDRLTADYYFVPGESYIVKDMKVGGWSSEVMLEEVPDKWFNTVMFDSI